jgi:phosphoglucomutase/phosphomannomutase
VLQQSSTGPRDLRIVYSPLHGVGATAVCPVLKKAGFREVEVFSLHAKPDGDFPNVPGNVSNPENPEVFVSMVEHCRHAGADLAVASDPDCDRIGCAAPLTYAENAAWDILTGNQIGALLADYILDSRRQQGRLSPENFVVSTLVTSQLTRRICESYGIRYFGDNLVGFKWIAGVIDAEGADKFLFGTEESYGYLAGQHVRDKDGAVAALLLCELAARLKAEGQTLHEKLEALFWQHGLHTERTVSVQMPGSEGMERMREVMQQFRDQPPRELAGSGVKQLRDYLLQTVTVCCGRSANRATSGAGSGDPRTTPLVGPKGDLVILDLAAEGNYVAVRPSGTEPKIKLYLFAYQPPEQLADMDAARQLLAERLDRMEADLRAFAGV